MKNKILTFIIGLLVGAIITTGVFFIYIKTIKMNFNQPGIMQMNEERGNMRQPGNMEQPPERPNGNNGME